MLSQQSTEVVKATAGVVAEHAVEITSRTVGVGVLVRCVAVQPDQEGVVGLTVGVVVAGQNPVERRETPRTASAAGSGPTRRSGCRSA